MDFSDYIYDSWLPTTVFVVTFRYMGKKSKIEDKLFEKMPGEIRRLNQQARREARQKARERYAKENGLR